MYVCTQLELLICLADLSARGVGCCSRDGLPNDELEALALGEGGDPPAAHYPVGDGEAQVLVCPPLQVWQVNWVLQRTQLSQHHHWHQLCILLNGHAYKPCTSEGQHDMCLQSDNMHIILCVSVIHRLPGNAYFVAAAEEDSSRTQLHLVYKVCEH